MLPRAVGYAKGILDYFFRGTLEVEVPEDRSAPGLGAGLRVKVRNNSPDDETARGNLVGVLEVDEGGTKSWLVSAAQQIEITRAPKDIVFQFGGGSPSPDATLTLMVVYQGPLKFAATGAGEEGGVAVGRAPLNPLDLDPKDPVLACGDSDPQITFTATGGLPPYRWSTTQGELTVEGANSETATLRPPQSTPSVSGVAYTRWAYSKAIGLANICGDWFFCRQGFSCTGEKRFDDFVSGGNPPPSIPRICKIGRAHV